MQELDISRRRMLCDEGQSQIGELLSKRERLCEQIDQLSESTGQYWRLSGERDELATAITMAEAEVGRVDRESAGFTAWLDRWRRNGTSSSVAG